MKRILDQFHRIKAVNAGRRAERYRSLRMEFAALFLP